MADLTGGHLEGRKQCRSAIAPVVVTVPRQSPAIRQLQISLGALQRLDRRLFVDADNDRVLRGRHVEPNHSGSLGDKLGIVALTPGFAAGEINLLPAQEAPDVLLVHGAQFGGNQRPGPAGKPDRRRAIQHRQNTAPGLTIVCRRRPGMRFVAQSSHALTGKPAAPAAHCPWHGAKRASNRPRRAAFVGEQNDPCAKHVALFRRRCPHARFKHRAIRRRQSNFRSFGNHSNVES